MHIVEVLEAEISEINEWVSESKIMLDSSKLDKGNTILQKPLDDFSEVEDLYETSKKFRIESEEVKQIQEVFKPIITWVEEATQFIETQASRAKSKGKRKGPTSGKKPGEESPTSKVEKKNTVNQYEILTRLPKFFDEKVIPMEVDPTPKVQEIEKVQESDDSKEENKGRVLLPNFRY